MRTKICMIMLLSAMTNLSAQEAVLTTGGNAAGSTGTVSYSIGQTFYTANSDATHGTVSQGVQQPVETLLGIDIKDIILDFKVYPNPTASVLNLSFGQYDIANVSYQVFDVSGREIVKRKPVHHSTEIINIENLAATTYLLQISKNNKVIKIFKILKQ